MANNIALSKGLKINEYTIAKKISSGGFSVVYLAYDKLGQPVAIKEFFPNHLHLRTKGAHIDFINMREKHRFQEGLKAFKDETEIVMRLKHRNIIEIVNFFEMNGTAYIVMPYEYGMTLSKYIATEKNPLENEIISIIEGVFNAVQMFHENNIIHLDLKPGNIWLRPNKEALILDFGTARIIDDVVKSKQPPMHTPGYAAPEQHREFFQPQRVGVWTDYYGLGTTLYALIERTSPSPSPEYLLNNNMITLVNERRGQFSEQLLKIVEILTQPDWEKRKKINLKEIINLFKKIKPVVRTEIMTLMLNNQMNKAAILFHEQQKLTENLE
jgi:serine/threonine protein kinase